MVTYSKSRSLGTGLQADVRITSSKAHVSGKTAYFLIKRVIDLFVSLFIILFVLSWLFPIVALLIKATSKGPVFFIQRRVGKGGRSFPCLKFRTMVVNDHAHIRQAHEHDSRITRIGRFLRHSNLDEFPQFINVLLGHMSIVGPRPHMHADCSKFSSVIPGYKFRNMVRPGITGLAQIKGYRGPTNDFTSMFHRYQFDAFYVRNANFWLDMRIIRKTAAQTLRMVGKRLKAGKVPQKMAAYRKWAAVIAVVIFIR